MRNTVVVARLEGRAHGWHEQYRERFGEEVQGEHVIRHQQRLGLARQERLEPAPPTEREPPPVGRTRACGTGISRRWARPMQAATRFRRHRS